MLSILFITLPFSEFSIYNRKKKQQQHKKGALNRKFSNGLQFAFAELSEKKNALAWTRSSPKSIGFSLSSETETENTGLTKVYTRSSFLFSLVFLMGLPTVIMSVSLTLVPTLGTLFLLLVCCVQIQYDSFCIISLYFILSCLLSIRSLFFSNVRQKLGGPRGQRKWGETGRNREKGNCNQDILYG